MINTWLGILCGYFEFHRGNLFAEGLRGVVNKATALPCVSEVGNGKGGWLRGRPAEGARSRTLLLARVCVAALFEVNERGSGRGPALNEDKYAS